VKDLDDFNNLEAIDGIDEKSETAANEPLKKKPMPMRCRLCMSGVLKVNCLVCDVMAYEQ
jgi:hypothetical protein